MKTASLLALCLTFVLALAAPTAGAAPLVSRGQVPVSVIDAGQTGQLTIRFTPANPYNDRPGPSHVGVEVQLRRVADIDLTTPEGWAEAEALTLADLLALPDSAFDTHRSGVSDSTGTVVFSGLPLGLYVVSSPAEPEAFDTFVITLPRTSSDGTAWLYDLIVHPKRHGEPTTGPAPTTPWETIWPSQVVPSSPATFTPSPTHSPPVPGDAGPAQRLRDRLASTGATVLGVTALGLVLVALGIAAVYRERKHRKSE